MMDENHKMPVCETSAIQAIMKGVAEMEAGLGQEAEVVFAELERKFPFLKSSR